MIKHRPSRIIPAAVVVAVLLITQFTATVAFAATDQTDSSILISGYIGASSGGSSQENDSENPNPSNPSSPSSPSSPSIPSSPDIPDIPNPDNHNPGALDTGYPEQIESIPSNPIAIGGGPSPKTGDETSLPLYTLTFLFSMMLAIFLLVRIRKENETVKQES